MEEEDRRKLGRKWEEEEKDEGNREPRKGRRK